MEDQNFSNRSYTTEEIRARDQKLFNYSSKEIRRGVESATKSPDTTKKRWFWELVQNAKDSVNSGEKVSVEILFGMDEQEKLFVQFSHSGNPFSRKDAENLIIPDTDKDDDEPEKSGKFGTGFLSTHFLSFFIDVQGIMVRDGSHYSFDIKLDRSGVENSDGKVRESIATATGISWYNFEDSQKIDQNASQLQKDSHPTKFKYKEIRIPQDEIEWTFDYIQLAIPYVLAFNPQLDSITIKNQLKSDHLEIKYTRNGEVKLIKTDGEQEVYELHEFSLKKPQDKRFYYDVLQSPVPQTQKLLIGKNGPVWIAVEIAEENEQWRLKEKQDSLPSLFCDFPLIGEKDFYFPVVVNIETNSASPVEERSTLYLNNSLDGISNKKLFERVPKLFLGITKILIEKNGIDLFYLAKFLNSTINVQQFDSDWFEKEIKNPIRRSLLESEVVLVAKTDVERKKLKEVFIPKDKKSEVREKLWQFMADIFPEKVPKKQEIHHWYEYSWAECNTVGTKNFLVDFWKESNLQEGEEPIFEHLISILRNLTQVSSYVTEIHETELNEETSIGNNLVYRWLNILISFVHNYDPKLLDDPSIMILPNQNEGFHEKRFKSKADLFLEEKAIDSDLKDIQAKIALQTKEKTKSWRSELLDQEIDYEEFPDDRKRNQDQLVSIIVDFVSKRLSDENPALDIRRIFGDLHKWISDPQKDKSLFSRINSHSLLYKSTDQRGIQTISTFIELDRSGKVSFERQKQILNDPQLLEKLELAESILAKQQREDEQFQENKAIGDLFEEVFKRLIEQNPRFSIVRLDGEQDFVITASGSKKKVYVEMKSISSFKSSVEMTPDQAKKAVATSENGYVLCVVPNQGEEINDNLILQKARFNITIGNAIMPKTQLIQQVENPDADVWIRFEEEFLKQFKKYPYKVHIGKNIWGSISYSQFIAYLTNFLSEESHSSPFSETR